MKFDSRSTTVPRPLRGSGAYPSVLNPTALPSLLFTREDWLARNLPFRGTNDALIAFYLLVGLGGLHALHSVFRSAASPTVPADRDDLAFGALAPRSTSTLDLPRSFSSSTFEVEAEPFALHVSGAGAPWGSPASASRVVGQRKRRRFAAVLASTTSGRAAIALVRRNPIRLRKCGLSSLSPTRGSDPQAHRQRALR